jgi:hypothetical protein
MPIAPDKIGPSNPNRPAHCIRLQAGGLNRVSRVVRPGFYWLLLGGCGWKFLTQRRPNPTALYIYFLIFIIYIGKLVCS